MGDSFALYAGSLRDSTFLLVCTKSLSIFNWVSRFSARQTQLEELVDDIFVADKYCDTPGMP